MHTIELHNGTIGLVEVTGTKVTIHNKIFLEEENGGGVWGTTILPPGSWHLVGITPLTEEQAGEVVECVGFEPYIGHGGTYIYKNYKESNKGCWTSIESMETMMLANNIDKNKRYAFLISRK